MNSQEAISSINYYFNLRTDLALTTRGQEHFAIKEEGIRVLRKVELMLIREHEETLRIELAPEIREMRALTKHQRTAYYFGCPRYAVAILLLIGEQ